MKDQNISVVKADSSDDSTVLFVFFHRVSDTLIINCQSSIVNSAQADNFRSIFPHIPWEVSFTP